MELITDWVIMFLISNYNLGAKTQILSFHYTLIVKWNINRNDLEISQNSFWEICYYLRHFLQLLRSSLLGKRTDSYPT